MQKLSAFSLFAILVGSMFSVLSGTIPIAAALGTNGKIVFDSSRGNNIFDMWFAINISHKLSSMGMRYLKKHWFCKKIFAYKWYL